MEENRINSNSEYTVKIIENEIFINIVDKNGSENEESIKLNIKPELVKFLTLKKISKMFETLPNHSD